MAVLAWHPHGPPRPMFDRYHPEPADLKSSATTSISAGVLPSGNFLPTGIPNRVYENEAQIGGASGVSSVALASSTGRPIQKVLLKGGGNSTDTLSKVVAPAATATASVSLTSHI